MGDMITGSVGRVIYWPRLRLCPIRKEARVNNSRHSPVHALANHSKRNGDAAQCYASKNPEERCL